MVKMMRDKRKDAKYFETYLLEVRQNISEYYELYNNIPAENQYGKTSCLGYIAHLYRNELVAMYSAGYPIPDIQRSFQQCMEATLLSVNDNQSYHPILELLALAVLLDYKRPDVVREILEKTGIQNMLSDIFVHYLDENWLIGENVSWCPWFSDFCKCPLEERSKFLEQYLSQKWYKGHKDDDWYNNHKSKLYTGYWGFEIAAVAKIYGVPDSEKWPYYPYDLVHSV